MVALLSPFPVPPGWCPPGYREQGAAGRSRQSAGVWGCTVGSPPAAGTLMLALGLLGQRRRFVQTAGCHHGHQGLEQHLLLLPCHLDDIFAMPRQCPLARQGTGGEPDPITTTRPGGVCRAQARGCL